MFFKKYYQLLLHGKFPVKETKLCLVGPPDSGKTSWFCPFEGLESSMKMVLFYHNWSFVTIISIIYFRNHSLNVYCRSSQ